MLSLLFGGALAFAVIQPIKVLPRMRIAPGYTLIDQSGDSFTSETARGRLTIYSFAPLDCGPECEEISTTMREVMTRIESEVDLGETELKLVTVALADDPSPAELTAASARAGADGDTWRWVGGDWDRVRTVVGAGFRVYFDHDDDGSIEFDTGYALVDGNGVIRGEYRYQTISSDADKIVRHVGLLADEIRYANGPASLVYEAAHLFTCYG